MNQPLLTVIVPCYNVEKYIDKCISSIVNQTYPNLEILLIDDGSADSTGKICDGWQEHDSRIRVIHKQNEGLAYARKTGVENATAGYVTFVDSDDWIDLDMYADMMSALLTTGSDIVHCSFRDVFEDGSINHHGSEQKTGAFEVAGRIDGTLLILENIRWHSSMCNKIFKKQLFEHVEFPKGRGMAEDFIAQYLFHNASQIVYLPYEYYFYFQRKGSITNPSQNLSVEMKIQRDISDAYYERYSFVKQHPEYHSVLSPVKHKTICLCIGLIRNMMVFPQYFTNEYFKVKAEQLRSIPLTHEDNLRAALKIEMYIIKMSPKLYKILRTFYVRIIHITNKLKLTNKQTSDLMFWRWQQPNCHEINQ